MKTENESTEIAVAEPAQSAILPAYSGAQMAEAFSAYRALQDELDRRMKDQIMRIGNKDFRKKGYWRAIRMAFNLRVECIEERKEEVGDDWGYVVQYRATAANGATTTGDGACFAAEKARGRMEATVHNVRSHAHTRAFNRAVSNLVGFGEVSAEEIGDEEKPKPRRESSPKPESQSRKNPEYDPSTDDRPATDPQRKRLYALCKNIGATDDEIKLFVLHLVGKKSSREMTRAEMDKCFKVLDTIQSHDEFVGALEGFEDVPY